MSAAAAVIAVRRIGSEVVHASTQSGQWANAPLFVRTLCGVEIRANGDWSEISAEAVGRIVAGHAPELRFCSRCNRKRYAAPGSEKDGAPVFDVILWGDVDQAHAAEIDQAHSAALAEDAARDSAALAARLAADPQEQRARREQNEWAEDKRRAAQRAEDAAFEAADYADDVADLSREQSADEAARATRVESEKAQDPAAWSRWALGGTWTPQTSAPESTLPSEQTDRETRRRCQGEGHPLRSDADACYCAGGPDATLPEQTSAPEVTPDTPWQEGDPAPRLVIADYGRIGWGEEAGPRHIVREVRGVDSDHGYDVRTLQQDDRDGTGTQGAADTLCGVVAYGVMYWPGQGPAVDCQACDDVHASDLAEDVAPLPDETDAERDIREWAERNDVPAETVRERFRRNAANVSQYWSDAQTGGPVARLEYLRGELRAERISYGELAELSDLRAHIDSGDVELLEAAGVPEVTGGPVPIAVQVTSAILGSDAGPHLSELHRTTVVDIGAQEALAAAYDALPLRADRALPLLADRAPLVALAWQAFAEETLTQAAALRALGVHWRPVDVDPYANAAELFAELRDTGTIRVLSTRETGGHPILPDHVNDAFRAVHDILGHAATGRGFDRHGEEAAFRAHSVLYSPLARLAMATETRGQNASMLRAGGVFPPERIAILPEWARALDVLQWRDTWNRAAYDDAARDHAAQGLGTWNA